MGDTVCRWVFCLPATGTGTRAADEIRTRKGHSHALGQYPDGLRGPMIIHDPDDPYAGQYDQEIVMTFSDWYVP